MTVTLTSPATIFELAELAGAMTRRHWLVAKTAWRTGGTYAFRADGELVALAGLFPTTLPSGDQVTELWFCPTPAAAPHMLGLLRVAKLTLAQAPYHSIHTIAGSEAGRRMARALGLIPYQSSELGEFWRYGGPTDRQGRQGRDQGAAGSAGGPAAPVAGPDGVREG